VIQSFDHQQDVVAKRKALKVRVRGAHCYRISRPPTLAGYTPPLAHGIGGFFCFVPNPAPTPFLRMTTSTPLVYSHASANASDAHAAWLRSGALGTTPLSVMAYDGSQIHSRRERKAKCRGAGSGVVHCAKGGEVESK